eukprot:g3570.t1 g3570   contig12:2343014-2344105(+)
MVVERFSQYFTEKNRNKYLFYFICLFFVVSTSIVTIIEPILTLPCDAARSELEFENVLFYYSPCLAHRYPQLLFMTQLECQRARHLLMAVFLGSLIGYERKEKDRPAGIRTMALVSLGSALFTINSTFGFLAGPMSWDASRVSAAIPSGVGFLGAGLIVKSSEKDPITGENHHLVQGITTAAATWLSAAVGLACGGGLYFTASFATAMNLVILRFGPRAAGSVGGDWTSNELLTGMDIENPDADGDKMSPDNKEQSYGGTTFETQHLRQNMASLSMRSRPGLGRVDTVSVRNRPTLM